MVYNMYQFTALVNSCMHSKGTVTLIDVRWAASLVWYAGLQLDTSIIILLTVGYNASAFYFLIYNKENGLTNMELENHVDYYS